MRILQLVKWLSAREDTGGKIRSFQLGRALASFACVDVVGFVRPGESVSGREEHLSHYDRLYPIPFNDAARNATTALAGFAAGLSLRSARFSDPAYRRSIDKILSENHYHAVQVEELSLMNHLGSRWRNLPIIYSAHNLESHLSPATVAGGNPLFRFLAGTERRRTVVEERRAVERSRACLAVSNQDRDSLLELCPGNRTPVHVIPNCAHDRFQPSLEPVSKDEILAVGCFGWYPNEDGMRWFMEAVLPGLRMMQPRLVIRVAGSEIGPSLGRKLRKCGFFVYPDVPDVLPFLQHARLLVVPLRIGGGTRIKIVEAWAAGVPVVSTGAGADGLPCRPGVDIVIADDPVHFAESIHSVLEDDLFYKKLRSEGLDQAKRLRWSGLAGALQGIYASALEEGRALGYTCQKPCSGS